MLKEYQQSEPVESRESDRFFAPVPGHTPFGENRIISKQICKRESGSELFVSSVRNPHSILSGIRTTARMLVGLAQHVREPFRQTTHSYNLIWFCNDSCNAEQQKYLFAIANNLKNCVGNIITMTGRVFNPMEVLVEQISKGQCKSSKVPIKKNYINEDPTKEVTVPCPQCLQRNLHHVVRYLYLNFKEAIYKCEASDCMYPFRNFKFKNYDDNTVYQYQPLSSHIALDHLFGYEHSYNSSQGSSTYEPSFEHLASVDFELDFLSTENGSQNGPLLAESSSQSLEELLHVDNLSKSFDTKFIDDMLTDLLPSSSDHLAPTQCAKLTITQPGSANQEKDTAKDEDIPTSKQNATGRKLEKCLKAFQTPSTVGNDSIFKKPSTPNCNLQPYKVENLSPTRLRIKKLPQHNGPKSKVSRERKQHALLKKKSLKPLEFLHTLNSLSERKVIEEPAALKPKKCSNPSNVQKMLSFIKRSMKNREHKDNYSSKASENSPAPNCVIKGDDSTSNSKPSTHGPHVAKSAVARTLKK